VSGCGNLGLLVETGVAGSAADRNAALQLFQRACTQGDPVACSYGALSLEKATTNPAAAARALAIYEKACNFPGGGGCATVAELKSAVPGVYDDEGYDRRACDQGDGRALACYNAAIVWSRGIAGTPDAAKASALFRKACEQGGLKKACGR
jgi:TPR repeat protein